MLATSKASTTVPSIWLCQCSAPCLHRSPSTISASFLPPPPEGFISPVAWGVEANVTERFGQAGISAGKISMAKDTYQFASPDKTPADFINLFEKYYGPTMNAVDAAQKTGKMDDLHAQLVQLANAQNKNTSGGTLIPATFLRVTVQV